MTIQDTSASIAVSLFVSVDKGILNIRSLAADDQISQAVERMLLEQVEQTFSYMSAAVTCAEAIAKAKP